MSSRVVHVQNILAFYRIPLWNRLAETPEFDFELILLARTEKKRARHSWRAEFEKIACPKTLLHDGVLEEGGSLALARSVWKELARRKPDLVIGGDYAHLADWAVAIWCRLHRIPFVCHYGSFADSRARTWWKEKLKRRFFSLVTHVAAYGTRARDYAVSLGARPERTMVLGNATPTEELSAEVDRIRRNGSNGNPWSLLSRKEILFVGRLSKEKNLMRLAEAFLHAREESGRRDMRLVLVGDGPMRGILEDFEASHPGTLELAGFKQRDEIAPYFARARSLVLPSIEEPWGLAVNEAMACGLPVLVSERCGCAEDLLREEGAGIRFDPLDRGDMARALRRIMSDDEDLDGAGEKSGRIIAGFSTDKAAARLIDLIRCALEKKDVEHG